MATSTARLMRAAKSCCELRRLFDTGREFNQQIDVAPSRNRRRKTRTSAGAHALAPMCAWWSA
jgi:hypothetical protein